MNKEDLEKLKLLAKDNREYCKLVVEKIRLNAIKNNHDMSEIESDGWQDTNHITVLFRCYCKNCPYEVESESSEYINNSMKNEVSLLYSNLNLKCIKLI